MRTIKPSFPRSSPTQRPDLRGGFAQQVGPEPAELLVRGWYQVVWGQ